MPIRRELCKVERVMRTYVEGLVSFGEIREHVYQVRKSGTHHYPEIIDARRAELPSWTPRDVLNLAYMVTAQLGTHQLARRAIVVDNEMHFGVARVFSSLVVGWMRVGVFTDTESATAWLRGTAVVAADDGRRADPAAAVELQS